MTEERKNELYDQMIAWICEHTPSDEELFQVLHGEFHMTREELHDHSIESLDSFFPDTPKDRLKQRNSQTISLSWRRSRCWRT